MCEHNRDCDCDVFRYPVRLAELDPAVWERFSLSLEEIAAELVTDDDGQSLGMPEGFAAVEVYRLVNRAAQLAAAVAKDWDVLTCDVDA
jgi:hypothetical protein